MKVALKFDLTRADSGRESPRHHCEAEWWFTVCKHYSSMRNPSGVESSAHDREVPRGSRGGRPRVCRPGPAVDVPVS